MEGDHSRFGSERDDFAAARDRLAQLAETLERHGCIEGFQLAAACREAAVALRRAVERCPEPGDYRVAVIGRFKVGKSSFVNELLGERLAGVNTNPETAAITTFRAGPEVRASITIIERERWEALRAIWRTEPTDPEAHRIKNWESFRGKVSEDDKPVDLDRIEQEHFRLSDRRVVLTPSGEALATDRRKALAEFGRKVKLYTTSTRPHHCLVERIEIETPSEMLAEGVILIDTPGLDDTERFRVQLTEEAVRDIDAMLFLTKSGASYGQGEKDFLLSLLRRGAVRQVVVVVTQVDDTLQKAADDAEAEGVDPEPAQTIIAREAGRIRGQLMATLDEVAAQSGGEAAARYRDQLDALDLAFVSAKNHRAFVDGKPVSNPVSPADPGGMLTTKETLFRLLSTESRLAQARRDLRDDARAALLKFVAAVETRQAAVARVRDHEEAEQTLATFRSGIEEVRKRFQEVTAAEARSFSDRVLARRDVQAAQAEAVALQSEIVLRDYEALDAARHWATRRRGGWGSMHDLQNRVANRVFPKVQAELDATRAQFESFLEDFGGHVARLASDADAALQGLDLGAGVSLDIQRTLNTFLDEATATLQNAIEDENQRIVALLENFVTDEVEQRIADARNEVSDVWGRGTVVRQTERVQDFYKKIRRILQKAVQSHIESRFEIWSQLLSQQATELPQRSAARIDAELDRAAADIRAAAAMAAAGAREKFERDAKALLSEVTPELDRLDAKIGLIETVSEPDTSNEGAAEVGQSFPQILDTIELKSTKAVGRSHAGEGADLESLVARATRLVARHQLLDGDTGWSFQRILGDAPVGACRALLVDPYLEKSFQQRNLGEFILALFDREKIKCLFVHTKQIEIEKQKIEEFFSDLDKQTFEHCGGRVDLVIRSDIHDRYIVFDNGWVIKFGRGLDIFKPAPGLAARKQALRRVRGCVIDVFSPEHEPV